MGGRGGGECWVRIQADSVFWIAGRYRAGKSDAGASRT